MTIQSYKIQSHGIHHNLAKKKMHLLPGLNTASLSGSTFLTKKVEDKKVNFSKVTILSNLIIQKA